MGGIFGALRDALSALTDIVVPRCCMCCGQTLTRGERWVCLDCMLSLPRTGDHLLASTRLGDRMARHVGVCRTAGWFFYRRNSPYSNIIFEMKYAGMPDSARWLGAEYASEIAPSGFFGDVDVIVPVPMHWLKRLRRGYNQSEGIAAGIAGVTGKRVDRTVLTARRHGQQKSRNRADRAHSVLNSVYTLRSPDAVSGLHLLLVDDVATTGSTLEACVMALMSAPTPPRAISILTLAVTEND